MAALKLDYQSLSNKPGGEELLPQGRDRRDIDEKLENAEADEDDFPMRTMSPDYVVEEADDNQSVINPPTMTQLLVSAPIISEPF